MARRWLAVVGASAVAVGLLAVPAQAAPGSRTAAQVNAATQKGVAYIDAHQNSDGSFGSNYKVAETGMALLSYSVIDKGSFANLSASYQTHVKSAIAWLLATQDTTSSINKGSFALDSEDYRTYNTGIALAGLSAFSTVNSKVPAAITAGRAFLVNEFQAPPFEQCSSADNSPTATYCGGWNYEASTGRSDESNTGFAMTGLHLSGGVPAAVASVDIGWQHHIQAISSNSYAKGRNDGGGSYQPFDVASGGDSFASNANDTGSMLFSLAFDKVAASDPHVVAGIKFGQAVLDEYEVEAPANHTMVFHTTNTLTGTCKIGTTNCQWNHEPEEGGFHYSLFALSKGIGSYVSPDLTSASNWYAKVADLLLGEQQTDGSWPRDGRDDASIIFATGLSVSALGLVAVQTTPTVTVSGTSTTGTVTFTATVTPPASTTPVPTGTLTWTVTGPDGKTVPCSTTTKLAAGSGNTATATCTVNGATPGASYTATATYSGDPNYKAASGTGSVVTEQAASTTTTTVIAVLPRTGAGSTTPALVAALALVVAGLALAGLRRKPRTT